MGRKKVEKNENVDFSTKVPRVCAKLYECPFISEVFKEYRKKPFVSVLWVENHSQSLSLNNF